MCCITLLFHQGKNEHAQLHSNQPTALSTTTQHLITLPAALKAHGQFAIFSQPQCFVSPIFVLLGSHTLPSNRRAMICFSLVWRQLIWHYHALSDSVLSCSFFVRLLYYILYFKCCCNCMAFLFQEAASWGWWSIWPLTCLWRSFPTSHTILEACPPLVPQSNHLRESLFYAKGNWTTLMAGMLTLRCSLPKGEWHAERGECLATPVPEVPLAKLNAVFLNLFLFVFSDPLLKSTAQVLEGRMQHLQVLAFQWCTPERLACALSKRLWIIPVHDVTTCHNTVLPLEGLTCCGRCHAILILTCHDKIGMTCWSVCVLQKEIPLTIFTHKMDPDEVFTEH